MSVAIGLKINSVYLPLLPSEQNTHSTIIKIYSSNIVSLKTKFRNGYNAIVLETNISKNCKVKKEFYIKNVNDFKMGQIFNIENFTSNMLVNIQAKSIGKGFTGNIKRNNFKRGPMTHGSKNHRQPGSIGQSTTPGRVFKNKKMAGHAGFLINTIKNLKILDIDKTNSLLYLKGSIPGKSGNVVFIKNDF